MVQTTQTEKHLLQVTEQIITKVEVAKGVTNFNCYLGDDPLCKIDATIVPNTLRTLGRNSLLRAWLIIETGGIEAKLKIDRDQPDQKMREPDVYADYFLENLIKLNRRERPRTKK